MRQKIEGNCLERECAFEHFPYCGSDPGLTPGANVTAENKMLVGSQWKQWGQKSNAALPPPFDLSLITGKV